MYAYISRKDFAARRDALYHQVDRSMTQIEFYKAISPVVAQMRKPPEDGCIVTMWEDSQPSPTVEPNPKRFTGRAVLLIGHKTASAAMTLASVFKALRLGTVIGEETGDALSAYGDCLSPTFALE